MILKKRAAYRQIVTEVNGLKYFAKYSVSDAAGVEIES